MRARPKCCKVSSTRAGIALSRPLARRECLFCEETRLPHRLLQPHRPVLRWQQQQERPRRLPPLSVARLPCLPRRAVPSGRRLLRLRPSCLLRRPHQACRRRPSLLVAPRRHPSRRQPAQGAARRHHPLVDRLPESLYRPVHRRLAEGHPLWELRHLLVAPRVLRRQEVKVENLRSR